jgi:hypothetical protein
VGNHLGLHYGTRHQWLAQCDRLPFAHRQHLVERD